MPPNPKAEAKFNKKLDQIPTNYTLISHGNNQNMTFKHGDKVIKILDPKSLQSNLNVVHFLGEKAVLNGSFYEIQQGSILLRFPSIQRVDEARLSLEFPFIPNLVNPLENKRLEVLRKLHEVGIVHCDSTSGNPNMGISTTEENPNTVYVYDYDHMVRVGDAVNDVDVVENFFRRGDACENVDFDTETDAKDFFKSRPRTTHLHPENLHTPFTTASPIMGFGSTSSARSRFDNDASSCQRTLSFA